MTSWNELRANDPIGFKGTNPLEPKPEDTENIRRARNSLRDYVMDRRSRGVPREGWTIDESEEKDMD